MTTENLRQKRKSATELGMLKTSSVSNDRCYICFKKNSVNLLATQYVLWNENRISVVQFLMIRLQNVRQSHRLSSRGTTPIVRANRPCNFSCTIALRFASPITDQSLPSLTSHSTEYIKYNYLSYTIRYSYIVFISNLKRSKVNTANRFEALSDMVRMTGPPDARELLWQILNF